MAKSSRCRKSPPNFDGGTEQRISAAAILERELRRLAQDELLSDPKCLVAFARHLISRQAPPNDLQQIALLPIDKVRQAKAWRKRREELRKAYPVDGKERWREERRQLQLIGRGLDYDWRAIGCWRKRMELEGATKTDAWKAIAHLIPQPGRPKATALWRVIFVLGAYLEHLLNQRRLRWAIIAGLLNQSQESRTWTPTELQKGWDKRRRDFEMLDPRTFLYGALGHLARLIALDGARSDEQFRLFVAHALWRLGDHTEEGFRRLEAVKQRLEDLSSDHCCPS